MASAALLWASASCASRNCCEGTPPVIMKGIVKASCDEDDKRPRRNCLAVKPFFKTWSDMVGGLSFWVGRGIQHTGRSPLHRSNLVKMFHKLVSTSHIPPPIGIAPEMRARRSRSLHDKVNIANITFFVNAAWNLLLKYHRVYETGQGAPPVLAETRHRACRVGVMNVFSIPIYRVEFRAGRIPQSRDG